MKNGETFGLISEDVGAVGHEFDVRLSTLQRATADSAIKGLVEPKGIVTIASSDDDRRSSTTTPKDTNRESATTRRSPRSSTGNVQPAVGCSTPDPSRPHGECITTKRWAN